jgi:citrate synthase
VTSIGPDGHAYRGHAAVEASRHRRFEDVAELLWTGRFPDRPTRWEAPGELLAAAAAAMRAVDGPLVRPIDRLRLALDAAAIADPWRTDTRTEAMVETGRRLTATLAVALPRRWPGPEPERVAARLAARTADHELDPALVDVVDAALVLLADHELAGSTFAARIAASFGADVGSALGAAFGPFTGTRHGIVSIDVEELLGRVEVDGAEVALARWLARAEQVPGLGHPLYPDGDPRASELLTRLRAAAPDSPGVAAADELLAACRRRGLPPPNVDLGLGALTRTAGLAPGSGSVVFAVARCAGWVAHALEEHARPSALRPLARYVGPTAPGAEVR